MKSEDEDIDEPFMMMEHSAEEIADYDEGFAQGSDGKELTTPRVLLGKGDGLNHTRRVLCAFRSANHVGMAKARLQAVIAPETPRSGW
jgi:hypothetical protein